ncbi:MAG TPA: Bax inhibitor-1 family protein [Solirubrobacteraceae bacterium]|nr:Bax inhibitor-1 family protein [Solirubrobacteraceae bacterium]
MAGRSGNRAVRRGARVDRLRDPLRSLGGIPPLFFLLLALIVYGFVSLFVSMPAGNLIYALLGLGIFGGYTLLDFNRLRRAGTDDVVSLATGIFLDIVNVFQFFVQLFGNSRQD